MDEQLTQLCVWEADFGWVWVWMIEKSTESTQSSFTFNCNHFDETIQIIGVVNIFFVRKKIEIVFVDFGIFFYHHENHEKTSLVLSLSEQKNYVTNQTNCLSLNYSN